MAVVRLYHGSKKGIQGKINPIKTRYRHAENVKYFDEILEECNGADN